MICFRSQSELGAVSPRAGLPSATMGQLVRVTCRAPQPTPHHPVPRVHRTQTEWSSFAPTTGSEKQG